MCSTHSHTLTACAGYLGSGKTTLVKYILTQRHGHRIAVILNEIGEESGIEAAFVQDDGVRGVYSVHGVRGVYNVHGVREVYRVRGMRGVCIVGAAWPNRSISGGAGLCVT